MIEIEVNGTEQLIATFKRLAEKTQDRTALMRNLANTMEAAVLTNFDEGGRPAWAGLKYREGSPLVDTENLMSSITNDYDNDTATVGTNVAYAAIHQFGGKAGRGRKVDIPARPFLMLTEEDEADLIEDVQDYFQRLVG